MPSSAPPVDFDVAAVPPDLLDTCAPGEASAAVRSRVVAARERQRLRYGATGPRTNAALTPALIGLLAIGLVLSYIGPKVRRTAAVLGGVGFGFFVDELGKFITSDNDYFFKPAAGVIYMVFVLLFFLTFVLPQFAAVLQDFGAKVDPFILGFLNLFSGGSLQRFAIFALGIMPYITASIMLQLLTVVLPSLDKLRKEGEVGQQ